MLAVIEKYLQIKVFSLEQLCRKMTLFYLKIEKIEKIENSSLKNSLQYIKNKYWKTYFGK